MSWLDRLPSRLGRYVLLGDAIGRLGPAWVLFRLRYLIERRLGVLVRRSPISDWPTMQPAGEALSIIDVEALTGWLATHCDDDRRLRLRKHADDVAARRFDVFGEQVQLENWHHDARGDHRYEHSVHWSTVATPEGADIKFVWEPSRFSWVFDLVRLHLVDPDSGADDVFWDAFDEWCEQNQPNAGVNWSCGQEASIRLMAVVIAGSGFDATLTDERARRLARFAKVTAERVEANIGYARSQRNNHHASEAVGLLTAALLFPGLESSGRWRRLGERHLAEVCDKLVLADGGTSQYSTNYHRVFVHNFLWALQCYRSAGVRPPPVLIETLEKTTAVMESLVDPISGFAPFFGADDGARLLPLADVAHRRLVEDVAVCRAAIGAHRAAAAEPSESAAWFGLSERHQPSSPVRSLDPSVTEFPDFGVVVVSRAGTHVVLTARRYQFRPGHDDGLHCDIWIDGINRLSDAGTQSYHPTDQDLGPLDAADHHNGPRAIGFPLLRKASRFLWARWNGSGVSVDCTDTAIRLEGRAQVGSVWVQRTVAVADDGVRLIDSSNRRFTTHLGFDGAAPAVADGHAREQARWVSPGYGRAVERRKLVIESDAAPVRIDVR